MTDGIINVNKPAGWTSQDVCTKLRHVLHIKKIGHTGTLDPMATGVLPVCVGKATRIIEYYDRDPKSYHASMKLGIRTDTLDITGKILETSGYEEVSEKAVREAFKAYTGNVRQIPPKYSALKINGKRAYDLAREGKDFEIKPREIIIYDNEVTRIDLERGEIEFDVTCSKGTYIRTICDDIGSDLGCGAVMTALTRTASGYFRIEDSYTVEEIMEAEDPLVKLLIPADITLEKLGKIALNDNRITAFLNGNSSWGNGFRITQPSSFDVLYRVYGNNAFLGVGAVENGSLVPKKVIR
ncbi:MAG: tRNA pseudouridine(55) synthase TruB [Mogibacterium sp.]|nr:tRNA pseudouridine(55) synthase TruB [Mogibacterium sp.]